MLCITLRKWLHCFQISISLFLLTVTLYFTEVYISCKECLQVEKTEIGVSFLCSPYPISYPKNIWTTHFPFFCLLQIAGWIAHNPTSAYTLGGYTRAVWGEKPHAQIHSKGVSWGKGVWFSFLAFHVGLDSSQNREPLWVWKWNKTRKWHCRGSCSLLLLQSLSWTWVFLGEVHDILLNLFHDSAS